MNRFSQLNSLLMFLLLCLCSTSAMAALDNEFDHATTGFDLTGMHRSVSCETCHQSGVFKGTSKQCMGCHLQGRIASSSIPSNHIATNNDCESCHTVTQWSRVRIVDHSAVMGSCISCHNRSSAEGVPSNHPAMTADCSSCHRTSTWTSVQFGHSDAQPGQ
ncbi:cytochrome c3 family protein, partial [Thalassolituus oleivorans]|uniref:cytochrome c3 family protein n=1 Tax=Thalassolituus oleivorans TaxID=187493 RepID=UPI00240989A2